MPRRTDDGKRILCLSIQNCPRAGDYAARRKQGIFVGGLGHVRGSIINNAHALFAHIFNFPNHLRLVDTRNLLHRRADRLDAFRVERIQHWLQHVQPARPFGVIGIFMVRRWNKSEYCGHHV